MVNIIPVPRKTEEKKGKFTFNLTDVRVYLSQQFLPLREVIGMPLTDNEEYAQISIKYSSKEKQEGYSLEVEEDGIEIEACDCKGAFYALQSLKQMIMLSKQKGNDEIELSCVEIEHDCPKYQWRGLHLDESRHFFGKDTVKKLLDFMALYKLNRFHWHLSDDQGWRIEIQKYPLLTEIGSKRKGSQLHNWNCEEMDNTPVEGFYTKDDIKEIVEYAKKRQIEIVPEIDFPAHSAAAIAAYNNLACREIPCEVFDFFGEVIPKKRGINSWNRTLCLGKDEVLQFVYDVIDEVCELFPFEYFHVGGDEAPIDEWKQCDKCQKRIKKENLKDEVALQGWFTNKVNGHLKKHGKIMVGWNEILASGIADSDIVAQYWTPQKDKNVNRHIDEGGKVVLSCHKYFYFDMLYTYVTPKGTYSFTAKKANVTNDREKGVLGVEAEMWTEWTSSEKEILFKLFHRGLALSETAWSDEKTKNYRSFVSRLQKHKLIADQMGVYYGEDWLTLKKSGIKKTLLSKKHGFSIKDFDSEYRLNELGKK